MIAFSLLAAPTFAVASIAGESSKIAPIATTYTPIAEAPGPNKSNVSKRLPKEFLRPESLAVVTLNRGMESLLDELTLDDIANHLATRPIAYVLVWLEMTPDGGGEVKSNISAPEAFQLLGSARQFLKDNKAG